MSGRSLGRGLASLIPDELLDDDGAAPRPTLRMVPLDELSPNPEQPRETFERDALDTLADSIREHGVLTPLVARREEGRYVLIAGERRLRAAGLAGLAEVPVVVREAERPQEQLELALVENLQRADLDPVEAARGYQRLVDEHSYTQEQVATRVGRKRATIANALRLLRLPGFALDALREGRISAGHARALLPLEDPERLAAALQRVQDEELSVRATERMVSRLLDGTAARQREERKHREQGVRHTSQLLSQVLHTAVEIRPRRDGSGRIVIEYADVEDLDRLVEGLRTGN